MTLTHEQASIHNQQSIFQQVKEHLKHNPRCLNMLFPNSKQKGNEIYFDAPSYNSWSYNVNKAVVNDFRDSCHGEDIIDTYKKCSGMTNSYEAAREMARKLNITTDNKNRTMKKQDSGDVNHNNVILEQSKDTFQESQTNDSQIHSNTELENNQAKEERYISAKVELNKMIKSSSNSYEELRNHLYSQKKQLEPRRRIHKIMKGYYYSANYENAKIYVPKVKAFLSINKEFKDQPRIKLAKTISKGCNISFNEARYLITSLKREGYLKPTDQNLANDKIGKTKTLDKFFKITVR